MQAQVNHIGLLISDLVKARHFYGNILGLREVSRPDFFIKGIWYDLGALKLHLMLGVNASWDKKSFRLYDTHKFC